MKHSKKIIFLIAILFSFTAFAKLNCDISQINFTGNNVILKAGSKPQLFLFHNKSQQNYWLQRQLTLRSASAGWDSLLNKNQWSALVLASGKTNFVMACSQMQPGKVSQLNCKQQLKICAVKNAILGPRVQGSYWLTENQSRQNLTPALAKRGVKLGM